MVYYCCAYGCKESFRKGCGLSFHSFPSDENLRMRWTAALRRENFQPSKHSRLCSKHFTPDCFDTEAFGIGRKLKVNALPTIFVFSPKTPAKRKIPKERTSPMDVIKPGTSVLKKCRQKVLREDLTDKPVLFSSSNLPLGSKRYLKKIKLQSDALPTISSSTDQLNAGSGSEFDVTDQLGYFPNDHEYCKMEVDEMVSEDVTDPFLKEEDISQNSLNDCLPQMEEDTSFEAQQHHHQTSSEDNALENVSIDDVRSLRIQPFTESGLSWEKFPDQICRLCATNDELQPKQSIVRWLALLNEIVPGMVTLGDGLPQFICRPCAKKLYACIKLKKQFVEANEILQNTMGFTKPSDNDLDTSGIQHSKDIDVNFSAELEEVQSLTESADFTVNEDGDDDFVNEIYVTENSDFVNNGDKKFYIDLMDEKISISGNNSTSNSTFQNVLTEMGENTEEVTQLNYYKSESRREYKHTCLVCGDTFTTKDDIAKHFISHFHLKALKNGHELTTPLWKTEKSESGSECKHICLTCEQIFTTKDDINNHLVSHLQPEVLRNKHVELTTSSWKAEKRYTLIKPSSAQITSQHLQLETLNNNEQIELTSDWENEKYELVNSDSDLEFKYVCNKCGEPFRTKQLLIEHSKIHNKQINCKECNETFTSRTLFIKHNKIHKEPVNFACEFCDKKFTSKSCLRDHRRLTHPKGKSYICEYCSKAYSRKRELKLHQATHFPPDFSCSECGKKFHTKVLLNTHMRSHAPRFVCEICGKTISVRKNFESHLLLHAGIKSYQCADCGNLYASLVSLKRHEPVHSSNVFTCKICLKNFCRKDGLKKHMDCHNKKGFYECPICLRGFSRPSNRCRHRKRACTEIFCIVCKQRLPTIEELQEHRSNQHTEEEIKEASKQYKKDQLLYCVTCSLRVEMSSEMEEHMATVHDVHSLFKCNQCLRCFLSEDDLSLHGYPCTRGVVKKGIFPRKGRDAADLKCKVCQDFVALDFNEMKKHLVDVHDDHKPFKCEICPKSFQFKINLKQHILVHSNERPCSCSKCGKRYKRKSALYLHDITAHQNMYKFTCPFCERKFKRHDSQILHIRTHTGEKPFSCPICARRFAVKGEMKKHTNTHFGIKTKQKQRTVIL